MILIRQNSVHDLIVTFLRDLLDHLERKCQTYLGDPGRKFRQRLVIKTGSVTDTVPRFVKNKPRHHDAVGFLKMGAPGPLGARFRDTQSTGLKVLFGIFDLEQVQFFFFKSVSGTSTFFPEPRASRIMGSVSTSDGSAA